MSACIRWPLCLWAIAACSPAPPAREVAAPPREAKPAVAAKPMAAAVQTPCTTTPVRLAAPPNLVMPLDFYLPSQNNADCMAWQEFLYLNWRADPANPGLPDPGASVTSFGTPGDTSPTVWESYLTAEDIFASPKLQAWNAARPARKQLARLSKLGDAEVDLGDIQQAGSDGWLTDQSGNLIFYEIHVDQDEYNFIADNALTTGAGQAACATDSSGGSNPRGGFNLPGGGGASGTAQDTNCAGALKTYGQNFGAIEVKAAWRVLPGDHSLDYRYKTSAATLRLPDGTTQQATVGLVGLHIIHKTPSAQQFVWATFEQIDNTPDAGKTPTPPVLPPNAPPHAPHALPYTFFNLNCTAASDPVYGCHHNKTLVPSPPPPSPRPPCPKGRYKKDKCYPYWPPMQITRVTPVGATANDVTGYAWSLLPTGSVYRYYRLIDVQWPDSSQPVPPGAQVPLSSGDITPAAMTRVVANTTLETFMQHKSCMDCHQNAAIAQPNNQIMLRTPGRAVRRVFVTRQAAGGTPQYASDYSFIFSADTQQ